MLEAIGRHSDPELSKAVGDWGETLTEVALGRAGFRTIAVNAREHNGVRWTESNHDLDRLVEKDGTVYGVEVKNQIGYIEKEELNIKTKLAQHIGVKPLFIVRMMPKSYWFSVYNAGGFVLMTKIQYYPPLGRAEAKEARDVLGLPVECVREMPGSTLTRFAEWHARRLIE